VREEIGLRPGQKFCVMRLGNRIELVPLRPIKEMRGFARGMNTDFEREPDRL
jgi:bifunctional DNA-binding transcriptional regulator/antitoxin component of YhaV-PrlF toxin-antitoxin module